MFRLKQVFLLILPYLNKMKKKLSATGFFILSLFIMYSCSGAKFGNGDSLTPSEFKKNLDHKNTVLIDVRSPEEYSVGHLANAVLINFQDTSFQSTVLSTVPMDAEVLLYCRSGRRSAAAKDLMKQMGYLKVTHLDGGIIAWQAENFPVVK